MTHVTYDEIGKGYARQRRPDPRIAAQIREALGDVATLVNVGAGAGSYEPDDVSVVAVEPSWEMIRQRHTAAPVVQGVAESLPFANGTFDAALASLTIHHWTDVGHGFAELRRVTRDRIVIFTHEWRDDAPFWLVADYFPETIEIDRAVFPTLTEISEALEVEAIEPVRVPSDCVDGFLAAFWSRPEAYLDPDVRASMSVFPRLDPNVVTDGIEKLSSDLRSGLWDERYGGLRNQRSADFGYRLVIARA